MLKKLRWKIILINMALVSVVLLAALTVLYIVSSRNSTDMLYRSLDQSISFAMKPEKDTVTLGGSHTAGKLPVAQLPSVVVSISEDGTLNLLDEDGISLSDELLRESVALALDAPSPFGKLTEQKLAFLRRDAKNGYILALCDLTSSSAFLQKMVLLCAALFLGGTLVFFFISLGLSSIAVKPIAAAWQQQRQFVADASHELKTPLTVIIANNNIISAHKHEMVAQQDQWLHSTAEEANQMCQLIDQMLTLAKYETSEQTIRFRPVDFSDLLEEQILYLEPVAYERRVHLEAALPPHVVLDSDPVMLQHLAVILIENAIKYSPQEQTVAVCLTGGHTVRLTVRNEGPPIPPEDLPHIFDRFYRSDKARSTGGYGLGLAIGRSIAGNLHGKLSVESSEESGTVFTAEFKT